MTNFTPQYLKEMRIKQRNTLDEGLVKNVKNIILQANKEERESIEIAFRRDSPWQKVNDYFEALGFLVNSSGYIDTQYDTDGNEVYHFIYSWYIKTEEEWD